MCLLGITVTSDFKCLLTGNQILSNNLFEDAKSANLGM